MRPLNRLQIAWRAAQDIADGMVINLGMGMPVAVADYLRPEADVFIHSENGVIGAGPLAAPEHIDTDLVDAGSRRITPTASTFIRTCETAGTRCPFCGPQSRQALRTSAMYRCSILRIAF